MSKKIIFITGYFPFGKSEVWAINELNSLLNLGNEITIAPRSGGGEIINQDAIKFNSHLIDLPFISWPIIILLFKSILFKPSLIFKILLENIRQSNTIINFVKGVVIIPKSLLLAEILKNKNIDHIHSFQTTSTAFMAFILSYILKVPWSYTLHTSETLHSRFKRSIMHQSNSASLCRTISQKTANDLSSFIGPSLSKKVSMVHLGVDMEVDRKKTNIIDDSFIIATPAELIPRKGHIYGIQASKKLIDMGVKNFKWFFYGSGPLLSNLQRKVKDLDLIHHCFFPGNLDHHQLLNKYKNNEVDAVVISSISTDIPEGIPVALMEAMSYRIPVVASDCGATKELVNGESGILVDQKDSKAISDALSKLIKNPEFRAKVSNIVRNKVELECESM